MSPKFVVVQKSSTEYGALCLPGAGGYGELQK